MSQDRKRDFRSYPASTGFMRASPPRAILDPLRTKALKAYRQQADLGPRPEGGPTVREAELQSLQDISSPEDVNLEDLLDSERKAA